MPTEAIVRTRIFNRRLSASDVLRCKLQARVPTNLASNHRVHRPFIRKKGDSK
jgi:hypothetical protein